MDVRCEKCRTEYELDESKLKPGGVTVKCTSCGHMFKVRKRITAVGPAVVGPPTLRVEEDEPKTTPSAPAPNPSSQTDLMADEGLTWLVRLPDGEILTCRELSTLQKWIVGGRVTRVAQISRSGKKWKPLGEIGELATFFDIADEARHVAAKGAPPNRTLLGHPNVVPRASTAPSSPVSAIAEESAPVLVKKTEPAQPIPSPVNASTPAEAPAAVEKVNDGRGQDSQHSPREDRETGEWSGGGSVGLRGQVDPGRGGPVSRGAPATSGAPHRANPRPSSHAEVAGLGARLGDRKGEFENGAFIPTDVPTGDIHDMPSGGGGKLIAIISILIILAGIAVLYFVVFRDKGVEKDDKVAMAQDASVSKLDAAVEPIDPADVDGALALAKTEIAADSVAGLEVALDRLNGLGDSAKQDLPVKTAIAHVNIALAQHKLFEKRRLTRPSRQKRAEAEAREYAAAAEVLGKEIFDADASNVDGLVILGEALRVRNQPSNQVNRYLRKASKIDPTNRDAELAKAMLFVRDDNARQAVKLLKAQANSDKVDIRAAFRLALLQTEQKRYDEAKKHLADVVAASPKHEGAAALAKQIETLVPDKDEPDKDEPDKDEPDKDEPDKDDPPSVDSYDRLLESADSAADGGNCSKAIGLYEKAIEAKPNGVGALTGLGNCYLAARRFSSAHRKFRAALGVASRYQDAMWGMAVLYERQGNRVEAAARYQKFIDAHPGSGRAQTAKRKIEALTGSGSGTGAGSGAGRGSGTGAVVPQDPPDTPPGSGADSGSDSPAPTP